MQRHLLRAVLPREGPNRWDLLLLPMVIATLFMVVLGAQRMAAPYVPGAPLPLSLDPAALPGYTLQTVLRMALAMVASLVFTFTYGSLAAKSERAGRILIPLLDILQSVPILGFLSITVVGFLKLFPGSLLGPELAAVFAVFTSQAWNMAFSFYASLRVVPRDLHEAAAVLGLSAWQRFWRLEVPFATRNLVWNAMMSVAGGWFFVVAAEAISVEGYTINLPGVGSYIALAIAQKNGAAIAYAVTDMLLVILTTDQFLFRPLVAWAERFKVELSEGLLPPRSWLLTVLRRAHIGRFAAGLGGRLWDWSFRLLAGRRSRLPRGRRRRLTVRAGRALDRWWTLIVAAVAGVSIVALARFVHGEVGYGEIGQVAAYGLITALRVVVLTLLATLVWLPVGVWIGLRPRLAQRAQPVVVFLAAFPANLVFPVAVSAIIAWRLNPEIWLSPLMILGTQWYILFNVIAGAAALPADLKEAPRASGCAVGSCGSGCCCRRCFRPTSPVGSPHPAAPGTRASWPRSQAGAPTRSAPPGSAPTLPPARLSAIIRELPWGWR